MKRALAYSRQLPVDFANQVHYLMKLLVTLVSLSIVLMLDNVAWSEAFSQFLCYPLSSPVRGTAPTLLLASM